MTKILAFLVLSIALISTPVLAAYRDIQDVCDQTPQMGLFGKLLRKYPEIYAVYASQRNSTIYVPSDEAMKKYLASSENLFGNIYRRAATSVSQAKNQQEAGYSNMYSKRSLKRDTGGDIRTVRKTEDTDSSPTGRNSIIVKVVPGPQSGKIKRQYSNTTQSTGVVLYSGSGTVSNIIFGDIQCTQGVAHVVDTVFMLPQPPSKAIEQMGLNKFQGSLNGTDIGKTYDVADQITVFAPIDSAFTNQSSLSTSAIQYHTVNDNAIYSPDLKDGDVIKSSQGSNLYINVKDGVFYVNCVRIVKTDGISNNGVIHGVEKILTPLPAPPNCFSPPPVVVFTGTGSVDKVFNMMTVLGAVFAVVGLVL